MGVRYVSKNDAIALAHVQIKVHQVNRFRLDRLQPRQTISAVQGVNIHYYITTRLWNVLIPR
jgi:hypothetical protein